MEIKDRLDAAKTTLVVIGSGSPEQAKGFASKANFRGEIYVDQKLVSYKAFGLNRGVGRSLGLNSIIKGFSAIKRGFRQSAAAGDPWQQGGTFVLGPGDQILFEYRNENAGDHADLEKVIKACLTPFKGV
ncbi:peroxiredoxin-like family protein [Desulfatibacillum alkenivorans]|jgi:hypothetical protein|uniref:peroxiredoxin-like family protein n=1 Tax=Desulfatibacillum alkenivorans TaxID=259354 RepID=UPI000935B545|nr:peroxiredoxin-like family protein [Desulfatibacillum alkenivorans]